MGFAMPVADKSGDRDTGYLLPPSVDEWLPEQHLARFVVEVIDGLDLSAMSDSYRGSGSASYHLALLLGLRSEEHTSELQSLMRISYAVFCLKKKTTNSTACYI